MTIAIGMEWLDSLGVVPPRNAAVRRVYDRALSRLDLGATEYLTIRDLLAGAGLQDHRGWTALLVSLFDALGRGSICLRADTPALSRTLEVLADDAAALARECARALDQPPADLVAAGPDEFKPLVLLSEGGVRYLYFQQYCRYERAIKRSLDLLLRRPGLDAPADMPGILRTVLDRKPVRRDGKSVILNPDQKLALALGMLEPFLIVSGGPGTGKTSIVVALLRCLVRAGVAPSRIRLAAPTGRAAQRLADTVRAAIGSIKDADPCDLSLLDLPGSTVHRLLRYSPRRNRFLHDAGNPLPLDLLVVDEVSMVDAGMMARLLDAVPPEGRVVLLGDKDQLPSVEASAVLADLMPRAGNSQVSPSVSARIVTLFPDLELPAPTDPGASALVDHIAVLRQNYRSAKTILDVANAANAADARVADDTGRLRPLASSVNAGDGDAVVPDWPVMEEGTPDGGCWLFDAAGRSMAQWRHIVDSWISRQYLEPVSTAGGGGRPASYRQLVRRFAAKAAFDKIEESATAGLLDRLFAAVDGARILTLLRRGPYGCEGINRRVLAFLRDEFDASAPGELFAGTPVMVTRNEDGLGLFNGDVGILLRDRNRSYRGVFRRAGGYLSFALDSLPAYEPAFAITVHKSQGSEYGQVLLVLPEDPESRLLTKEIIYTGLTRARRLAVIYGTRAALRAALGRSIVRESGIRLWE